MSGMGLLLLAGGVLMVYAGITGERLTDRLRAILAGNHQLAPNAPGSGQSSGTATGGTRAL